jgi:hypothetical protein
MRPGVDFTNISLEAFTHEEAVFLVMLGTSSFPARHQKYSQAVKSVFLRFWELRA